MRKGGKVEETKREEEERERKISFIDGRVEYCWGKNKFC